MSSPDASQGIREGPESNQCSGLRWPHLNGRPLETHFSPSVLLKGMCSGCSVEGLWHGCSLPLASLAAVLLDSWWCFLRWSAQIASHSKSYERASGRCGVGLRIIVDAEEKPCWIWWLQGRNLFAICLQIWFAAGFGLAWKKRQTLTIMSRVQVDEFQETAGMCWAISAFMIAHDSTWYCTCDVSLDSVRMIYRNAFALRHTLCQCHNPWRSAPKVD